MDSQSQKSPQDIADEAIRRYLPEYAPDLAHRPRGRLPAFANAPPNDCKRLYRNMNLEEMTRFISL
ncbi:hypothetical protein HCH_03331 [Hahella chejuensis KCTC 2396]|uniref:Uncharacterized protein n=1 Tax=Hahella chejuensis (strain KCTC 2396) TaxID=349521 RepID=Q2SGY9_HAHCH|nr:hypothetical protein HCH_03331 [Hahella chejuensis KCTC 2396]